MKKIFVAENKTHYANHYLSSGKWALSNTIKDADLVMLVGGADVNPSYYGRKMHRATHIDTARDERDLAVALEASALGKKIVGICRGSQFLTVFAGGSLIQDVSHHGIYGTHLITWFDGKNTNMTSTHHQMMFPYDMPKNQYRILAHSAELRSDRYYVDEGIDIKDSFRVRGLQEPEIVHYPQIDAVAIQGHPEMLPSTHPGVVKVFDLIKAHMNDRLF